MCRRGARGVDGQHTAKCLPPNRDKNSDKAAKTIKKKTFKIILKKYYVYRHDEKKKCFSPRPRNLKNFVIFGTQLVF